MKKKKIILIAITLVVLSGILLWKLPLLHSKESNVRGMLNNVGFVNKTNTNVEKYIGTMEYQIKESPNNPALYNNLASAYIQKARENMDPSYYSLAEDNLKKAIELDDKNFQAMYLIGTICLSKHQFNDAMDWGNKAVGLNPDNAPIRGVIFDSQIELGQYDEALKTIQNMVDMRPDLTSFSRVSYYRELKGKLPEAIDAMKSAINAGAPHSENTAWCHVQLGNLYLNSGDTASADFEYRTALMEFPNFNQAISALANLQMIKGHNDEAIELYKQSLQYSPTAQAMIGLGDLYKITGQTDKAEEQYENVRFMNTMLRESGVDVDMELALFEADHNKNLDKSLKDAEQSLIKRPTIKSSNTLAWIQYRMGSYPEAEKNIEQALKLGTKDPLLYYHAGMIYQKTGQNEKAKQYLDYALKINPKLNELYQ